VPEYWAMPGSGTHTTIIQHLAESDPTFRAALGNPLLNKSWSGYNTPEALKSRYAILGAMGPDIFYAMLDYGPQVQTFEDIIAGIAGTFEAVGKVSGEINNLITSAADSLTNGLWSDLQTAFGFIGQILEEGIFDAVIDNANLWTFFLPLRQVDDYRQNWYWADFLHYVKTGCFAQKLVEMSKNYANDATTNEMLQAYSLGYLTHYVADTIGHSYVNRIVQSPWRNYWQRHHLVENFIDAFVWDHWHTQSDAVQGIADEQGLDIILSQAAADSSANTMGSGMAEFHYARLNDLCNIGSQGVDSSIDSVLSQVSDMVQKGLFQLGVTKVPKWQAPDDPRFLTWANFMVDALWQVYPPTLPLSGPQDHPIRLSLGTPGPLGCPDKGGYPTANDIIGAYGVYRMVLSMATEDNVDPPQFPNIAGDFLSILNQLWSEIQANFGSIPPPPPVSSSGGLSLQNLWNTLSNYVKWLGQVLAAVLETAVDLVGAFLQAGGDLLTDTLKVLLFLLNSALYALYQAVRMPLVLSAYAVPYTEDLNGSSGALQFPTLWNVTGDIDSTKYPIEPVLSERDLFHNTTNPFTPYKPYLRPIDLTPVHVEVPPTQFNMRLLAWTHPEQMLETPLGTDVMLSPNGPAPPLPVALTDNSGNAIASLNGFDGSKRFFGGIFANCASALNLAIAYLGGTPYPAGTAFPDYNLDSDRGYAWPCWDVDRTVPSANAPFHWNGCDPFPAATLAQWKKSGLGSLDWGPTTGAHAVPPPPNPPQAAPFLDPFGAPRNGTAWVSAAALGTTGNCGYENLPFSFIVVDPPKTKTPEPCGMAAFVNPASPTTTLPFDYQFAPSVLLQNDPKDGVAIPAPPIPVPAGSPPAGTENDGRLLDSLRLAVSANDPLQLLAASAIVNVGGTFDLGLAPGGTAPSSALLAKTLAQLAVTGRSNFEAFRGLLPLDDADPRLNAPVQAASPSSTAAQVTAAVHQTLDDAYSAIWMVRSNDPGWRGFRPSQGWIAASGFDDTPHRPVNVPTAPYPQFDLQFSVPVVGGKGATVGVETRYMIAGAHQYIGPNNPATSVFVDPDPTLLQAPAPTSPFSPSPAPRTLPPENPAIPSTAEIILYIHGGGSRAEEAVGLASNLIVEGNKVGKEYVVISLDLPNSAYGQRMPMFDAIPSPYEPAPLPALEFEQSFVIAFIDALDAKLKNVKKNIVAVMGGSLGGNLSLLFSMRNTRTHPYFKTIVAWSVTATAPTKLALVADKGWISAYLGKYVSQATSTEGFTDHQTESSYIENLYFSAILNQPPLPVIPADPIMWYRPGDWEFCKQSMIGQSRFDRYEIYSPDARRWTMAVDLEQLYLGFQDNCRYQHVASAASSRLLLAAGAKDNYFPSPIYNSTIDVAHLIRHTANGKVEFWKDTGHSFHDERPGLWAKEIVYFLTHLDAGDSPNGTQAVPLHEGFSITSQ
jgi:Zinc dependent phospholipase C